MLVLQLLGVDASVALAEAIGSTQQDVGASTVPSTVKYVAADGTEAELDAYTSMREVKDEPDASLASGWYVVDADASFAHRLYVQGEVNNVLADGATLAATQGIGVPEGASLAIFGQVGQTGALVASAEGMDDAAAIGGAERGTAAGSIFVHGGTITATGGLRAAAIGSACDGNADVTIDGGIVEATGGAEGAGIGSLAGDAGAGRIYLSWANEADRISSTSYAGAVALAKSFAKSDDEAQVYYAGDVTDVAALAGTLVPSLAQKEESEPEPVPQPAGEKTEEEKPEVGPDTESQPASEKMAEVQPGAPPAGEAKPADELDAGKADAAAG